MEFVASLDPFIAKLRGGRRCLMLALGDSNTANGDRTRGGKQWPELLHTELRIRYGTKALLLVNAGVNGDTVEDAVARFDRDVARFSPELTIVALGANDAVHLDAPRFRAGLVAILDRLAEVGSIPVLQTPNPNAEHRPPPSRLWDGDRALRSMVEVINDVGKQREVVVVDTYAQWWDLFRREQLDVRAVMTDDVHPNAAGHRLMYRGFAEAFGLGDRLHFEREPG